MDEHFSICFRSEVVPKLLQGLLEDGVIFDNAVVHQCQPAIARLMWVGVDIVRLTVRGPSRMSDADGSLYLAVGGVLFELSHLAFSFVHMDATVEQSNTGAVITAVFESPEPFDENGVGLARSNVSYNSTHGVMVLYK